MMALRMQRLFTPNARLVRPKVSLRAGSQGQTHALKVNPKDLLAVCQEAAKAGAQVVMDAADKPRSIYSKGGTDIVTDTDKPRTFGIVPTANAAVYALQASEVACLAVIRRAFPGHCVLGEEGGVLGDVASDYLWCVDPLDGTCNFAHSYRGFCVSVGVLRHATPVAGCVIEFTGGPGDWGTRTYAGSRNGGATVDGRPLSVSGVRTLDRALVVTEMVYYEDQWSCNMELLKAFTERAGGIRCSGAAAVNLCHLASGVTDAYYQFELKPWDVTAGIVILEEAGGRVSTCDGLAYSCFDRSLLATNDALYEQVLQVVEPATSRMLAAGVKLPPGNIPPGYRVRSGAQLE